MEDQAKNIGKLKEFDFEYSIEDSEHIFFTSDTHFNHKNIIKYCDRPYASIDEMNADLIQKWNSVVGHNDTIFHLGDVVFGGVERWEEILKQLNGHKILIYGNHDYGNSEAMLDKFFEWRGKSAKIRINHFQIYLQHFPYLCFEGAWKDEKATWQLFGHVHTNKNNKNGLDNSRMKYLMPSQYDVGVDNNEYKPVSFKQVKEIIQQQIKNAEIQ